MITSMAQPTPTPTPIPELPPISMHLSGRSFVQHWHYSTGAQPNSLCHKASAQGIMLWQMFTVVFEDFD